MDLKTRLARSAAAWCAAWSEDGGDPAPYSRLSKRVVDDGKFFDNLASMRRGPSTDTLEKFARFFIDPANWPSGATGDEPGAEHQRGRPRGLEAMVPVSPVPEEVLQFCHAVGVTSTPRAMSPGKAGSITPPTECAA